jgi:hypothetical protein
MTRRAFLALFQICCLPAIAAGQAAYTFSDPSIYVGGGHRLPILDSYDDAESYSASATLNGLNGGTNWFGAYVDSGIYLAIGATDDMESYTATASLNGLNGGTNYNASWGGAYVDR